MFEVREGERRRRRSDWQQAGTVCLDSRRRRLAAAELGRPDPLPATPLATGPSVPPEVAGVVGTVHQVLTVDWASLSTTEAMATLEAAERARRALDVAIGHGIATADRLGNIEKKTGLRAHHWLAHATHGSRAAASRSRKVGRILVHFPHFAAAIAVGELSPDHAALLAGVANARIRARLVEVDAELVTVARSLSFEDFRRKLRGIAERLDEDGPEPRDCSETDTVAMGRDFRGALHLRSEFTDHQAAVVEEALNAETDRQYSSAAAEAEAVGSSVPSRGVLRARALFDLIRRGRATSAATSAAARTEAVVVVHADESLSPDCCRDGEPLPRHVADVLTCDADVHPLLFSADGAPLWAGRTVRFATPAMRRALAVRDGGCIFPGCDAPPSWCDAHHIVHWKNKGRTDINKLAFLCRRHHGLVHTKGWSLEAVAPPPGGWPGDRPPPQAFVWVTPWGARIPAQSAATRRASRAAA